MKKTIDVAFEIGQIVYFVTDNEQKQYMVTGYIVRNDRVIYLISNCGAEERAYDFELSGEKDVSML